MYTQKNLSNMHFYRNFVPFGCSESIGWLPIFFIYCVMSTNLHIVEGIYVSVIQSSHIKHQIMESGSCCLIMCDILAPEHRSFHFAKVDALYFTYYLLGTTNAWFNNRPVSTGFWIITPFNTIFNGKIINGQIYTLSQLIMESFWKYNHF